MSSASAASSTSSATSRSSRPKADASSGSTSTARSRIAVTSSARPPPRPSRPWRPGPTSSTRRRSSMGRGVVTPTSCCRVDDPDRPSVWGPYHYEVADTKLARHVKASAVLQICSYVDQLERIQGVRPEWLHVVLGGSARAVERLRVDDYMAYYRSARDRFLATAVEAGQPVAFPPPDTYPEPVDHCDVCRWAAECVARGGRTTISASWPGSRGASVAPCPNAVSATLAALGDLRAADAAQARGHVRWRIGAGPRPGPDPARGTSRAAVEVRAAGAFPRRAVRSRTWSRDAPATVDGRSVLRHRGRPVCVRGWPRLPLRRAWGRRHVPRASGRATTTGEFSLQGERQAFEEFIDFVMASVSRPTRRCTSITTRRTSPPPSSG